MSHPKKLQGKRIVITGGSMGIGYAVAEECCRQGGEVSLVARNRAALVQAHEKLAHHPGKNTVHPADVGDLEQVRLLSRELSVQFKQIDGLVNCAGLYGPIGQLQETDPREFARAVNINLMGTYYMCRFLIPLMNGVDRAKIVNYSGGGGSTPLPNYSAYACSKAAVIRLTENMALELAGLRVDVNVIAPGFVPTRIHLQTLEVGARAGKSFYESTRKQMEEKTGSPTRAAQLTAFLLSSRSDGISGKLISAIWDPWEEPAFQEKLHGKDFAALRRIDGKQFKENPG
ncbi:MAG: SDR family oxidoreductase [Deltaproteobacteria bacterium]|nr:SDR family oxidoreductase [Deltaproteobacteria bacterium]